MSIDNRTIHQLKSLVEIAPVQVAACLEMIRDSPDATVLQRRAIDRVRGTFGELRVAPPGGSVPFPVAFGESAVLSVCGGILTAEARPPPPKSPALDPQQFPPDRADAIATLARRAANDGWRLGFAPSSIDLVSNVALKGDSCAGALLAAWRAKQQRRSVKPRFVVSCALEVVRDDFVLRGVTRLREKAQAVAAEMPDATFVFVAARGERTSDLPGGLRLLELPDGASSSCLLEVLLEPARLGGNELRDGFERAQQLYGVQRYDEAKQEYERFLEGLGSLAEGFSLEAFDEQAFVAETRLGLSQLHRAMQPDADRWFARAALRGNPARFDLDVQVESAAARAESAVDDLRPKTAHRLLALHEGELAQPVRTTADRRRLRALLGMHRLHRFLIGDEEGAFNAQLRLVELTVELDEKPRALLDLAECLRRLGRPAEAVANLAEAKAALARMAAESYREETRGFLLRVESLLACDLGEPAPAELANVRLGLAVGGSTARWLLDLQASTHDLIAGDEAASTRLLSLRTGFGVETRLTTLLVGGAFTRAARFAPRPLAASCTGIARELLRTLAEKLPEHPTLAEAIRAYDRATNDGEIDDAAARVRRFSPY